MQFAKQKNAEGLQVPGKAFTGFLRQDAVCFGYPDNQYGKQGRTYSPSVN